MEQFAFTIHSRSSIGFWVGCSVLLGDTYFGSGRHSNGSIGEQNTLNQAMVGLNPRKIPTNRKAKDLVGVPWRTAFALQEDGWYLRSASPWVHPVCLV